MKPQQSIGMAIDNRAANSGDTSNSPLIARVEAVRLIGVQTCSGVKRSAVALLLCINDGNAGPRKSLRQRMIAIRA